MPDHSHSLLLYVDRLILPGALFVALLVFLISWLFWSRQNLVLAGLLAMCGGAAAWGLATWLTATFPEDRPSLPPITLDTLDGGMINLHDFQGQAVVVNLWATWCLPCRQEMPLLAEFQQQRPDIHFLFLNQAETPQQVREYLEDEALQLENVLLDSHGVSYRLLMTRGLPSTYFFNADGSMADYHAGELSRVALNRKLRKLR